MSFDAVPSRPLRIAVVGGGISGLSAAFLLSGAHRVTLFEAEGRLGGHARTVVAGRRGDQPVDTGFIVFNYANYPHLTRLFHDLDVPVAKCEMSFGATIDNGAVEYGLKDFAAILGQRRNLLRPGYLRMLRDLVRFCGGAEAAVGDRPVTVGELVEEMGLGDWFQRYYLLPICGAIWSTPPEAIRDFPARSIVRFFRNHALLNTNDPHQWWTVDGGSIEYVRRLEAAIRGRGAVIRTGAPVRSVLRGPEVLVRAEGAEPEAFDRVVFACHSDQALAMLGDASAEERRILSALRYQDNRMVLHCDPDEMPRRRACWSSWVYKADHSRPATTVGVTYWMNVLQNIPKSDPLFVSLNPAKEIPERLVYDEAVFRHPVFDAGAIAAQGELAGIQGAGGAWFAGAYTRHGFHEDGIASAVRVARAMDREFA